MNRTVFCCLGIAVALAGCAGSAPGGGGNIHGDAALEAACRQRADEIYDRQNRPAIYSPAPGVNSPFSGSYSPAVSDRGLSDLYARDTAIRDCVRNTGTGTDRVAQTPASAPPATATGVTKAGPPPGSPPARR
jgi:hypothetical protein